MNNGVIACLCPPAALAERLAALVPGGMPAEQLHLTLAYFGDRESLDDALIERIRAVLMNAAKEQTAIVGSINGVCRLATPDGDALVAIVDLPLLPSFREELVEQFESVGASVSKQHGFVPHITLAYLEPSAPSPLVRLDPIPVTFGAIELWTADTHEWFPLRTTYSKPKGEYAYGAQVSLSAPSAAEGGVWNVLAYEVELKSRGAALTRRMFEECIRNFARYPKVPIVIEHADTRYDADKLPKEWSEPHGWISELRIGSMQRNNALVATLEGRILFDETTRTEVNAEPPKWPFGSVTIFPAAIDEETDASIGALLWSFSLTSHPALIDVPRLAASRIPEATTEQTPMKSFLALAILFGMSASNEEEAHAKLEARAAEGNDVRKALNLGSNAPAADVSARLAELSTSAARVPALEAELKLHRDAATKAREAEIAAHINDWIAVDPLAREDSRAALEVFASSDYEKFSQKYPRPSLQEIVQRSQDGARFSRLAGNATGAPADASAGPSEERIHLEAMRLIEAAKQRGERLSYADALGMIDGSLPDSDSFVGDGTDALGDE